MVPSAWWFGVSFALPIGVAVVGLLLALLGWVGQRIGDHPHCRRCGFDLYGSMQAMGGRPANCPECGVSLGPKRRVTRGWRRRRWSVVAVGLVMVLGSAGWSGVAVWTGGVRVELNPYKPVWLLRYEAERHGTVASYLALKELIARLHGGRLGPSAVDLLVAEGVRVQADPSIPWEPRWGEVVEYSREQGWVVDADWHGYMETAVGSSLSLEVRPRVRIGDPIYMSRVRTGARLSDSGRRWQVMSRMRGFVIDGIEDPRSERYAGRSGGSLSGRSGRGSSGRMVAFNQEVWGGLEPGTYDAAQTVEIELFEVDPVTHRSIEPAFLVIERTLTDTFELTDEPTVKAVVLDEHRQGVRDALKIDSIEFKPGRWPRFDFSIELDHPPVAIAFDVFVVDAEGREAKIGTVTEAAMDATHLRTGHSAEGLTWEAEVADVVFRPSGERASRTTDVFEYWGEEVVFEGVSIELPAALQGTGE
ncbi:MAG: hypothetical protein AAF823_03745 [Planctomycetota bacterium]